MKLRWTTRTSLFARMSLLFGLLVTIPLIISGIVLSLAGRQGVFQAGNAVASIGQVAVDQAAQRVKNVAGDTLEKTADKNVEVTATHLGKALDSAKEEGKKALNTSAALMQKRGTGAVQKATDQVVVEGRKALHSSMSQLRSLNRASLTSLSSNFSADMDREWKQQSASPVKNKLQDALRRLWESSAERRASSIQDFDTLTVNQIVARMQYPVRHKAVINNYPPAAQILERNIRRNMRSPVVRVVVVDQDGAELVRIPEDDLQQNEDAEDWADAAKYPRAAATRTAFLRSNKPYVEEPVRFDERSKAWVRRIVHQVIQSESPEPTGLMTDSGEKGPAPTKKTGFIVVDVAMDNLVELAASDTLAPLKMTVALVHAPSGEVISSYPKLPKETGQRLLAKLPKAPEDAEKYAQKMFGFEYASGEEKMLARARYWGDRLPGDRNSGGDRIWVVVAQPEDEVLKPAVDLEKDIRDAWQAALGKVKANSAALIEKQSQAAGLKQQELVARAERTMREEEARQRTAVTVGFVKDTQSSLKELEEGLANKVAALKGDATMEMGVASDTQIETAMARLDREAGVETEQVRTLVGVNATRVANHSAKRMLLNSTWLVPLFLVLALILATLTAKSLVRPINLLVKGTQAVAAGEYNQRIRVQGEDELSRLAFAFNDMAGAIERGQSELQQSHAVLAAEKARIQGIVESSPDGLVMLEPTGQVAFINPTAVRLLDLPAEALPPAPFELSRLPEPAACRLDECLQRARAAEHIAEYEISEPQRRVLQLRDVRLESGEGRFYGHLLHVHDITHERVVDEMKTDFISLVSHELRTPLTSILGFSSYMLTGKLGQVSETQHTALDSIHRQAKRLSAIISDFLDISRIESGKIEMKKEPVPLAMVAGRVVEDLRPQASEKSIDVVTHVDDGTLPMIALGDEQRIVQVFTNLVGNALKFTEREGRVDLNLSRENGEVLCRVRDSGCGIPPDELGRVFDRFYQVEKVVTRKSGGTGLGLAIVKNIIEAHGGRVWIESELGKGTVVSFTLPGSH